MQPDSPVSDTDHREDDLRLLRSLPAESVDLVYLDPPVFSGWEPEHSWAFEEMLRILKPSGALFLICDAAVGLYVRILLDELMGPQEIRDRTVWRKADSGPEHHYIFYYHRSAEIGRPDPLYTVVRRHGTVDCSLVAFSFVQGWRVCRAPDLRAVTPGLSRRGGADPTVHA